MMMTIPELYAIFSEVGQISTDTRKIKPKSIFFALKGANFDGNRFAQEALSKGASYAVIDDKHFHTGQRTILVDDVLKTLQKLANHHRKQFSIPFLAITGSNGKTTTKELTNAVLSKKHHVYATEGNLNNHIGVPLTLLNIKKDIDIAIVEMGANRPGDIKELCEIAEPTHGIITNIGNAHLGGFGGYEGVVKTKTELYDFLRKTGGHVFVNADNPLLMEKSRGISVSTYCSTPSCDTWAQDISSGLFLKMRYQENIISTHLVGSYNFENALASICIGKYFRVEDPQIINAIENYIPSNNRSQIIKTALNTIVLDAYNANPTSMEKAINNLRHLQNVLLVLGDMKELGAWEAEAHQKIIDIIKETPHFKAVLVGNAFSKTQNHSFPCVSSAEEARKHFVQNPVSNHTILLKGSRSMALETLIDLF